MHSTIQNDSYLVPVYWNGNINDSIRLANYTRYTKYQKIVPVDTQISVLDHRTHSHMVYYISHMVQVHTTVVAYYKRVELQRDT